jgi:hypothetical protein
VASRRILSSALYLIVAVVDFALFAILVVTKAGSGVWYLYLMMAFFAINGTAALRAGLARRAADKSLVNH